MSVSVLKYLCEECTTVSEVRIAAEPRTEFGKGGARRTRRAGLVPAVLYGHGESPRHLSLPAHALMRAFKTDAGANVLLTLELSGGGTELALPKEVQRDAIRGDFEHIDLVLVRRGEKVTIDVAVTLTGEAVSEVLVDQQMTSISVEAEATHIPNGFEVDVTGLKVGDRITAGDIELPRGTTLIVDPDYVVVFGLPAPTADQVDAELDEAAAENAGPASAAPVVAETDEVLPGDGGAPAGG